MISPTKRHWLIVSFLMALTVPLPADDHQMDIDAFSKIEEKFFTDMPLFVSSISRYEEKVTDAPGLVTTLTYEQIKKMGFRTIPEIVASVTGFHEKNFGSKRDVLMSGAGTILFLINGIPMRTYLFESRAFLSEAYGLEYIKQIEIVRGPGSVLWGNNAIFGIVNIITKSGQDKDKIRTYASYGFGNGDRNRRQIGAEYSKKFNKNTSLYTQLNHLKREGSIFTLNDSLYDRFVNDWQWGNRGTTQNKEDYFTEFFAKLVSYNLTIETRLADEKDYYSFSEYNGLLKEHENGWRRDPKKYISLTYEHSFSDRLKAIMLTNYQRHLYKQRYPLYPPSPAIPYGYALFNRIEIDTFGLETQLHARLNEQNQLIAGLYFENNAFNEGKEYYNNPNGPGHESAPYDFMEGPFSANVYSAYIQDEHKLCDNIKIIGALRSDNYGAIENDTSTGHPDHKKVGSRQATTSKFSVISQVMPNTRLKLLYGRGVRAPYYDSLLAKGYISGEPVLKNEIADSYAVELSRQITDQVTGLADYSYYDIAMAGVVDTGAGSVTPVTKSKKVKSVSAEIRGNFTRTSYGYVNYCHVSVEDEDELSNNLEGSYPDNILNIGIAASIHKNITATLRGKYVDEVTGTGMSYAGLNGERTDTIKSYAIADLGVTISQALHMPLDISFFVYNLFDKTYNEVFYELARPNPKRSFIVRADYKFK